MKADELAAALQACASGLYPLEAGVSLLISSGAFLHRSDLTGWFCSRLVTALAREF